MNFFISVSGLSIALIVGMIIAKPYNGTLRGFIFFGTPMLIWIITDMIIEEIEKSKKKVK